MHIIFDLFFVMLTIRIQCVESLWLNIRKLADREVGRYEVELDSEAGSTKVIIVSAYHSIVVVQTTCVMSAIWIFFVS